MATLAEAPRYRIVRCANGMYTSGSMDFSVDELRRRESTLSFDACLAMIQRYAGPLRELEPTEDACFNDYREYVAETGFEHFELWEYDKSGAYLGALPETFPTRRAAWKERKAMVRAPRLRAYWHIVGFSAGVYYDEGKVIEDPRSTVPETPRFKVVRAASHANGDELYDVLDRKTGLCRHADSLGMYYRDAKREAAQLNEACYD